MTREMMIKKKLSPGCDVAGHIIIKKLAEGRYGICYLTEYNEEKYILKLLKRRTNIKRAGRGQFEAEILAVLNHPSIPQVYKIVNIGDLHGYVIQFFEGMTLEHLIFKEKCQYRRAQIYDIGEKLINIIGYLHGQNIVHRDIRIPNIIINESDLYLIDFGLANYIDNKSYKPDIDFSYLGDTLLYLYYSTYEKKKGKSKPWFKELDLTDSEQRLLKKLMGLEDRYLSIIEIRNDFQDIIKQSGMNLCRADVDSFVQ